MPGAGSARPGTLRGVVPPQRDVPPQKGPAGGPAGPAKARRASKPAPPTLKAPARPSPPASARLTIKPGLRPALAPLSALPPRPRPGGLRRLSEVRLEEDEVLIDGFDAMLADIKVKITAVLERTCVYVNREGDRRLALKKDLWVEADKLPIRRRGVN